MSTLKKVEVPDHPEQMKLVGFYRGHVVEMNVPLIRTLFGVDTSYYLHIQELGDGLSLC